MKLLGVILIAGLLPVAALGDEAPGPKEVIEQAVHLFAESMDGRHEELIADRESFYALIDEILLPRFDRKFAAQLVLAKHWRRADASQRERFIAAFYHALVRRYADGLLEFQQEMVTVLPFRGDASRPRARIKSAVTLNDGTQISVDYELVKRDSGWLLFNVVIEGISYIRNYRAELDSEIRNSSLDAVIVRFEKEAGSSSDE